MLREILIAGILYVSACHAHSDPGMKITLYERGYQYLATIAMDTLQKQMQHLGIPDHSGVKDTPFGHVSYNFTNIQMKSFTPPRTTVATQPLKWSLAGSTMVLTADWSYVYRAGLLPFRDRGNLDLILSVDLETTVDLDEDDTGRPRVRTRACHGNITKIQVHFYGGESWIYNMFDGKIEAFIRERFQDRICNEVDTVINEKAEAKLANISVILDIHDKVILDYRLVSDPVLTAKYIDLPVKGEYYWKSDMKEYPMPPDRLPANHSDSSMVGFWITQYSLNSLAYAIYKHEPLTHDFTKAELPPKRQYMLETTCRAWFEPCIGSLFPKIQELYPNSVVFLEMSATRAPIMQFTSSGVQSDWWGLIKYHVQSNFSTHFLFSTYVKASFMLEPYVEQTAIKAKFTHYKQDMAVEESAIGDIEVDKLNVLMNTVMEEYVVPQLQVFAEEGIAMPKLENVCYRRPIIKYEPGSLYVGVDLQYMELQ